MRVLIIAFAALASVAHAANFSFEDLVALIQARKLTTMEATIAALPANLRSNYELMSDSLSVQPSTPQNPRAILFGDNAKFVVTFNGDENAPNYDRLEIIQYREQEKVFEMRFIRFSDSGQVEISDKNPQECLNCHSQNPQPIWGSYLDWQGSFASDDLLGKSSPVYQGFKSFVATQPKHPRYKSLIRKTGAPNFPFIDGDSDDQVQLATHSLRPGDRLTNYFIRLMAKRIAPSIVQSAYFKAHTQRVLLGLVAVADQDTTGKCLDQKSQDNLKALLLADFNELYPQTKYPKLYKALAAIKDPSEVAGFLLEKLTSGPTGRWHINRFAGTGVIGEAVAYNTGTADIYGHLSAEILQLMGSSVPELKGHIAYLGTAQMFPADYLAKEVAPYDKIYDSLGLVVDPVAFSGACTGLAKKAF